MKAVGLGILALAVCIGLAFGLGLIDLEFQKFFAPKYENVKREVFENTKSYSHGAIADLGKYYGEYKTAEAKGDNEAMEAIKSVIQVRFAEFDTEKIDNFKMKQFLVSMRGY